MRALRERQDTDSFQKALELCVCISQSLQFVTCNSLVYDKPFCGKWTEADPDETLDVEFKEVDEYCKFRRALSKYTFFLVNTLSVVSADSPGISRLPSNVQPDIDTLNEMIDKMPQDNQLQACVRRPGGTYVWYYHSSYLQETGNNRFARSALLRSVPAVMWQLDKCKKICTVAIRESAADRARRHETLYGWCNEAYNEWEGMAKKKMQMPVLALRRREEGGRAASGRRRPTTAPAGRARPAAPAQDALLELQALLNKL
jgi:hypothetical protein